MREIFLFFFSFFKGMWFINPLVIFRLAHPTFELNSEPREKKVSNSFFRTNLVPIIDYSDTLIRIIMTTTQKKSICSQHSLHLFWVQYQLFYSLYSTFPYVFPSLKKNQKKLRWHLLYCKLMICATKIEEVTGCQK